MICKLDKNNQDKRKQWEDKYRNAYFHSKNSIVSFQTNNSLKVKMYNQNKELEKLKDIYNNHSSLKMSTEYKYISNIFWAHYSEHKALLVLHIKYIYGEKDDMNLIIWRLQDHENTKFIFMNSVLKMKQFQELIMIIYYSYLSLVKDKPRSPHNFISRVSSIRV